MTPERVAEGTGQGEGGVVEGGGIRGGEGRGGGGGRAKVAAALEYMGASVETVCFVRASVKTSVQVGVQT